MYKIGAKFRLKQEALDESKVLTYANPEMEALKSAINQGNVENVLEVVAKRNIEGNAIRLYNPFTVGEENEGENGWWYNESQVEEIKLLEGAEEV